MLNKDLISAPRGTILECVTTVFHPHNGNLVASAGDTVKVVSSDSSVWLNVLAKGRVRTIYNKGHYDLTSCFSPAVYQKSMSESEFLGLSLSVTAPGTVFRPVAMAKEGTFGHREHRNMVIYRTSYWGAVFAVRVARDESYMVRTRDIHKWSPQCLKEMAWVLDKVATTGKLP